MSDCDIALITRPSGFGEFVPFAELALTAYLRKEGLKPYIIDANPLIRRPIIVEDNIFKKYLKYVKSEILRVNPRFIGIGAFTSDYDFVIYISKEIKSYFNGKIIIGNVHASIAPEDFIFKNSPIDIAVIGEGELTLSEILRFDKTNIHDLNKINGICFYDPNSDKNILTNRRALIEDLSILPMPSYYDIDMSFYVKPVKSIIGYSYYVAIPLFTGRGCPYKCKFCASNSAWGKRAVRQRPIDHVIDEVRFLIDNYKIDAIEIVDDTFTISKIRVHEFCKKIKPFNLVWGAQSRVNLINEDLIKIMSESGCIQITFGVESGSQRLLDLMEKGCTVEDTKKAFMLCKKHNIRTLANMMFNLPEEEEEDIKLSYDLFKFIKPDEFGLGLTVAYPGTAIYNKYFSIKLKKDEYHLLAKARGFGKGRFRLCHHSLDLQQLLVEFRTDLKIQHCFPLFLRVLFTKDYWRIILNSHYRYKYFIAIIKGLPTGLIRIAGILLLNFSSFLPTKIKKFSIKFATKMGEKYGN